MTTRLIVSNPDPQRTCSVCRKSFTGGPGEPHVYVCQPCTVHGGAIAFEYCCWHKRKLDAPAPTSALLALLHEKFSLDGYHADRCVRAAVDVGLLVWREHDFLPNGWVPGYGEVA
jgi:hypothetical protein